MVAKTVALRVRLLAPLNAAFVWLFASMRAEMDLEHGRIFERLFASLVRAHVRAMISVVLGGDVRFDTCLPVRRKVAVWARKRSFTTRLFVRALVRAEARHFSRYIVALLAVQKLRLRLLQVGGRCCR